MSSRTVTADELRRLTTRILDAAGSPPDESALVAEMLVRSNLVGHDSHGVQQIPGYIRLQKNGAIQPGAPFEILKETPAMALVDGHRGWGSLVAHRAMRLAMAKARECGIGIVSIRECNHVGRVGEYPSMAAAEGMIGLVFVNTYGNDRPTVVPFGGIDGRFSPNPLAFAAPSGYPWPVLVDLTSSVYPEGKVRLARYKGSTVPPDTIIDANGNPTIDPSAFYGPPQGALLPLGGHVGHKGTGLAVIDELLAGALSGAGCAGVARLHWGNGVTLQAIDISHFQPVEDFVATVQRLIGWVKSSRPRPGVTEILFPGEPEHRTLDQRSREGIPVEDTIWAELEATAEKLGVTL